MSGRVILWLSVIVLAIGAGLLTIAPVSPTAPEMLADAAGERALWLVPVAYFLMLVAAFGLCWGWFMKRRDD